ncbi:hypothetical protein [Kribbella sp. NPDC048915]|uniref:hypothetical protein n=1 Tax=Kribbella sp. NPDC048915 TaxID=3155148 RepID=UPI0033D24BC6
MTRSPSITLSITLAALLLSLTACGQGDDQQTAAPPAVTPTPTPSPTATTPAAPITRTKTELTKALLELADLPEGFTEEDSDENAVRFSAPTSSCKALMKYLNAAEAKGAKASVTRSFSGGPEGPDIDYGLHSMGTAAKVEELRESYADAVESCPKVTLKTEGAGNTSMKVETITAPQYGSKPFAFRLTGTSGPKRGLEYVAVVTGVDDVTLSVRILAGQDLELDAATEAAFTKARSVVQPA